jgi:rhodanese-related sulfurtransferase
MEITQFLQQNIYYLLSGILLLFIFRSHILAKVYNLENIDSQDAFQLFQNKATQTVFLDIRTKWELEREPRIKRSITIPLSELSARMDEVKSVSAEKKLIVVCHSGNRAKGAGVKLKRAGISDVHVLRGGMIAWRRGDYPVTKIKRKPNSSPG